jgi:hypothetical protein
MNILDENISKNQRQLLESWRVSIKQIGVNIGRSGMKDDEILSFLHHQRRPTFLHATTDFSNHRNAIHGIVLSIWMSRNMKPHSSSAAC